MKKRLFAALLAGAVAVSLMACGGGSSSAPAGGEATQASGVLLQAKLQAAPDPTRSTSSARLCLPSTGPTSRPVLRRIPRITPK